MKTEDMWYNEYIRPQKSRTGGHHTSSVRGLRIYKQFPLCIQKTGSFPEGMICVVFSGVEEEQGGWLSLSDSGSRDCIFCVRPKSSSSTVRHSPGVESSPAAVSHWEYQWVETNFVHGPWLGHPLG